MSRPPVGDRTFAVLMAGGSGTRFWPMSRRSRPKQVLPIADERPMIRATVDRLEGLAPPERILVVAGGDQAGLVAEALPGIPTENFIREPAPRNTAPCIGLAAVVAESRTPGAVLLCLPADHVIRPEEVFRATALRALERADEARTLLTFGVVPDRPATGYGYIRVGEESAPGIRAVEKFVEKPGPEEAARYLEAGSYLWNSGMFAWRADVFLEEVRRHLPELGDGLAALGEDPDRLTELFPRLPAISVDYGVMERTDRAEVVAAEFRWDDVGSFEAIARLVSPDASGNFVRGEVVALGSEGLVAWAGEGKLIAALGVQDLVIVSAGDVTLVCSRDRAEDVKRLVEEISARGRADLL